MKRVKPYLKKEWLDKLGNFIDTWDFYKEGVLMELEETVRTFVGKRFAIATNSTTNSIFMCLYIWSRIHPDRKQVIIPNYGYPAAYKACQVLGLIPIPMDRDWETDT